MPRTAFAPARPPRRGAILLVVMVLLALFTVVGLGFVYYADSQATAARASREAQSLARPDVEPELLLAYFLAQLLYDVPDDETGVYSALRGHSLGRGMFGLNYQFAADGSIKRGAGGELVDGAGNALNAVPFNGPGRQHFDPRLPFPAIPDDTPAKDDANLINYTYFPRDRFLRDPERRGWRSGLRPPGVADNRRPHTDAANAPYTYPDLNNIFLAAVQADGTVLLPSYHRPWAGFGAIDPGNWRWTRDVDPTLRPGEPLYGKPQPWLKYLVLRPRPADMGPGFPLPEDASGDVKNLVDGPGGNDSVWLDLGFPVLTGPDGRKFRPLFAPLIVDLDSRVNLNVHGNLRGANGTRHASNQGWGPWEVNPEQLAPLPSRSDRGYPAALARRLDAAHLLSGRIGTPGRYGLDKVPHSTLPGNAAPGPRARFYAPADFDGSRELAGPRGPAGAPSAPLPLPGSRPALPFQCFPAPAARAGYGNGSTEERTGHPLLYNPVKPAAGDRAFPLADLELFVRVGDTGAPALTSNLARLAPKFFADPADAAGSARRRRLVTLASFDPDRPGVTIPVADALGRGAVLERRLDLNRYLPDYPNPDPRTGRITDLTGFLVAQAARQHMAAEVFEVLWRATGSGDPAITPPPSSPSHDAARWDTLRDLAQFAVNIVDYIDSDDCMTPFVWFADARTGGHERVYGTELPRVVLNEVYAEYANDPTDAPPDTKEPVATRLKGNVWVELYNAFQDDPPLTAPHRAGAAQLEMPAAGGLPGYGIYRLILARLTGDIRQPDNARGEIPRGGGQILGVLTSFGPAPTSPPPAVDSRVIHPAAPGAAGYTGPPGGNQGFYVLGPTLTDREKSPFPPTPGRPLETLRRPELSYLVRATHPGLLLRPSVLWQRLACPHLPPQPDPRAPYHNPYITVDYVRDVEPNYAAALGIDGPLDPLPVPPAERASVGRRQPYAAHPSQLRRQQSAPALADQPQHTFFQHNTDATTPGPNRGAAPRNYPPFEWLVHLDRHLVSPTELLHVSAFGPHELTQQFRTGDAAAQRFNHRAAWFDEDQAVSVARPRGLYRALEFLGTRCRLHGTMTAATACPDGFGPPNGATPVLYPNRQVTPAAMSGTTASGGNWRIEAGDCLVIDRGTAAEEVVRVKVVGPRPRPTWFVADFLRPHAANFTIEAVTVAERVPGRINLNTVWDEETFLALCDPNPSSRFKDGAVRAMFEKLRDSRTVGGKAPGPDDRPFLSLAAGPPPAEPGEGGLQGSLLRSDDPDAPTRLPLLALPGRPHPYQTCELLTKIWNNATVRSNVFAVWVTVGLFEVTDANARPVKLGREIGRAENRHVRHRMFALVDRSVLLANPGPPANGRLDLRAIPGPQATGRVVPYFTVIR
ncbi:MAG: hypothetical protein IT429_13510 [Gemmataceae bacterium]|nr:hypothetical protein [Gemmataceae bacterium]